MSINKRVFVYFLSMVLSVMLILFLGINIYVGTYYYSNKLMQMEDTIELVEAAVEESDTTVALRVNLEYISYIFGVKITIYEEGVNMDTLIQDNVFYQQGNIVRTIEKRDMSAYICEQQQDGAQWMVYGHQLGSGHIVVLSIPVESIDHTIAGVKNFFVPLTMIGVVVASFLAAVLASSMSRPITRLNRIAKEMSKLNFNIKYEGNRNDEIGQLGFTLNELMTYLEKTINDLKHELSKEKHLDVLRKRFVGQVSHELQTPLSVINGYVEALTDGVVQDEDERQEYYAIIEEEVGKMSRMVKELLDLSQLESGNFKMSKEPFDVTLLLDNIDHTHRFIAEQKQIHWVYKPIDDGFTVNGDEARLEQAIRNILHNAFKHTGEDGTIKIEAAKSISKDRLVLTIKNNGDLIPEDQLDMIWESFYKARTSDKKQGTGLGLAIAANIFNHHKITYRAFNEDEWVVFEIAMEGYHIDR